MRLWMLALTTIRTCTAGPDGWGRKTDGTNKRARRGGEERRDHGQRRHGHCSETLSVLKPLDTLSRKVDSGPAVACTICTLPRWPTRLKGSRRLVGTEARSASIVVVVASEGRTPKEHTTYSTFGVCLSVTLAVTTATHPSDLLPFSTTYLF